MSDEYRSIQISVPDTINELLQTLKKRPNALLYAGGTQILREQPDRFIRLPAEIIELRHVEELHRISRTEKYVEIGAAVTVGTLLELSARVFPEMFYQAIRHISRPGTAHLATIGGNICVPNSIMTLTPVLHVFDAKIELRRQGKSHWLPLSRFRDESGKTIIEPGEVMTRIRIPIKSWEHSRFYNYGAAYLPNTNPLTIAAVAETEKDILADIRIALAVGGKHIIRRRELEAELVGRRIPLQQRDLDLLHRRVGEMLEQRGYLRDHVSYERIERLLSAFANGIGS
ncbi:MAG: xanthine dehydrogenase family protein subunit M [Spirochaetia bacterium]